LASNGIFTFLLTAYNKLPFLYTASGPFWCKSQTVSALLSRCNYHVIMLYTRGGSFSIASHLL